ncbi:DUF2917 domain-containing protein [Acidovorax sp. PRC11]|uniref:DUF2917 domain-containing protein n=1 Tax=Acidovorax sp. PRC11 TaxID=2962592 RepID=UPI0028826568|nr:DUF2917 domain-containing protein [Acidovorax sp. PRC11]MDT0138227.1 DUF2917 domain-containing protein [Acidovorax sp. PRC11]
MTASQVLNFQQSPARDRSAGAEVYRLDAGCAHSLRPRSPMALRIASGRAWVTVDDGPQGGCDLAPGDIFLQAGQTYWIAAGQHAVIEPLGTEPVRYRFDAARAVKGEAAAAHGAMPARGPVGCA